MKTQVKRAIAIVDMLNSDQNNNWLYCAEIDTTANTARIAVYDEDGIKLGYLGEFDIIKTEAVTA
jgi:hypothetical protein